MSDIPPARDLIDFHLRWKEFRPMMVKFCDKIGRQDSEGKTLHWLVALADRVSLDDLEVGQGRNTNID